MPSSVQDPLSIEEIKPITNPAAKRLRLTYGPYKIKGKDVSAFGVDHSHSRLTFR